MSGELISRPSCILSIIVLILLVSSTGLLVMVLKGDYPPKEITNGSLHHHHHHNHQNETTSNQATPDDVQSDQSPGHPPDEPWKDFRLPDFVRPVHYDLRLQPDLRTDTFEGRVVIEVNVTRRMRYFLVHASPLLSIHYAELLDVQQQLDLELEKKFSYERNDFFVMEAKDDVEVGSYKLMYIFSGRLDRGIVGFYKSSYRNSRNETRFLATSKFQPIFARRAFPCFDEPGFKATFNVSLVHEAGYTALSNMPPLVTEPYQGTDLYITKFMRSVPMVTYLTCFIVCDFQYKELITSSGKPFRVYSHPDAVNTTTYALETGVKILEYFEKYFGIGYPLPKMDLIAIPDFPSGASEHWGLITFRPERLLVDPRETPPIYRQKVAAVIAHELVHMWFGNLVTMEWWDDLWLNEGFASYVEYMGVDYQHPDWDIQSQFLIEDLQLVMATDATVASFAIAQPVTHPGQIFGKFSKISYAKGASVARVMKSFVGNENFQKGISNFLIKHQFQNAITKDLWTEVSSACGRQGDRSISDIMNTWTEQVGFPYVTVTRKYANASTFVAKQRRFLRNEEMHRQKEDSSQKSVWSIPLSYKSSDGMEGIVWIHDDAETEFSLPMKEFDWLKFNVNQTGFYLVNYDKGNWEKLSDVLLNNHELMSPPDRSNLLFDSFSLAEAGHVSFDLFLTLSLYLKNETHYTPWATAQTAFQRILRLLDRDPETTVLLEDHIRYLTGDLYTELGWNTTEDHLENLLRTIIIDLACSAGDQNCLDHASQLFMEWTKGERIPVGVRNLVFKFGMAESGEEEEWDLMWNKYQAEDSPSLKSAYLEGLAHVQDPALIQRLLEYSMDSKKIRYQDINTVLAYLFDNRAARKQAWSFFNTVKRYPGNIVKKYCEYLTSEDELKQMKEYMSPQPNSTLPNHYMEEIQVNIRFFDIHHGDLKVWLETSAPAPWLHHRLPSHVLPLHYDLQLHPMLDNDTFSGHVGIEVQLQRPSSCFVLHSVELNLTQVEVTFEEKGEIKSVDLEKFFHHQEHGYLVLETKERLAIGRYKLYFEFDGPLTLSLTGLYKSSYLDPVSNETRYLATTQFESINARRAFPCFDEPRFKTTFNVSIVHDPRHIALSNAIEESTSEMENGLLVTRFQKTLPMVTYLLAVVVSDYEYRETITENGVRLRVYTPPHHIEKTDYALQAGNTILSYYENYFDIPFPLKKLDMISIPDFSQNGMENWGLVTFSEQSLIWENVSTSKHHVIYVISHELVHMWFGDLVTMEWWSDLWLNEGFATYMSLRGAKLVEPDYDLNHEWRTSVLMGAMEVDQKLHSHPIIQPVGRVDSELFDTIVYSKGASVLGMLENFMGEDFRIGVSAYLKKYSFRNAETENLWDELTEVSKLGLNVSTLMRTWTHQMNYPFLSVHRNDNASGSYTIQQHRYLNQPQSRQLAMLQSPNEYSWQIPVSYRSSNSNETLYMLLNTTDEVNLTISESDWVKLNLNFTGFYSVNYDVGSWKTFIKILETNHTSFYPADRLSLVYDALTLASSGDLDYGVALNLTRYLRRERDPCVWRITLKKLYRLQEYFLESDDTKHAIREYIRSLSKDLFRKYSWNDSDNYSERELKKNLIEAACYSGNQDCLLTAGRLLKQWMEGSELSKEIKHLVFEYGLQVHDDSTTWNYLWNCYLQENDPSEKKLLLKALSSTRNEDILGRLIEYAKDDQLVRKHDFYSVMMNIIRNPKGRPLVATFLVNNWEFLVREYEILRSEQIAQGVFSGYNSQKDLEKVREFYKKHPKTKNGAKHRSKTIENINGNINWIRNHRDIVQKWFSDNVYMPWNTSRLPTHISPSTYNITLHPDITRGNFEGESSIELEVSRSTDCILFHQSGLEISDVRLSNLPGVVVGIEEEFPYERNSLHVVRLKREVQIGRYVLRMKFSGEFAKDGRGLGRYQYIDGTTKEERYLVASQFEPTFARKVFPCFDEPAMKAKFHLAIVHNSTLTALSNMPEEEKVLLENGLVKTVFKETALMSTYLLFSAVSDFGYLQTDYKGKQVRAYAPHGHLLEADHGLNLTTRILEKLEDFFGVPYPLPKLDSVIVPGYNVPGMEHWGAIAYSDDRFLVDYNSRSALHARVMEVDRVIAHELVHQWIGNLVTMSWWNDLWLKEGLSSLVMYLPLKDYYPEIEEVNVRQMSRMMCIDSTADSHPIIMNATTPEEIVNTFDAVSYEKGAAVLKMLQHTLKEDFRSGISAYLKKYAYQNAETKDLWAELSNATSLELNVGEMMDTWTRQMGFPCVEIHRKGKMVTATQQWFVRNQDPSAAARIAQKLHYAPFGFIWKIPLVYKNLRTGEEHTLWLNNKNETFQLNASSDDVIKFNPSFVGFYIVKYEPLEWAKLGQRLRRNHLDFSVSDRYSLLHDSFVLAESGHLSYDIPLRLSRYLEAESDSMPWALFRDFIFRLGRRLGYDTGQLLKTYVADLTSKSYDENIVAIRRKTYFKNWKNFNEDCFYAVPHPDFLFVLVELACKAASEKCLAEMREELHQWMKGNHIKLDLKLVLELAIPRFGNATVWEYLHEELVANDTSEATKQIMAEGLALFTDPQLVMKTIDAMALDLKIGSDVAQLMFKGLADNPEAMSLLWEYSKNNWNKLINRLATKNNPSVGLSTFCEKFKTSEQLGEMIQFLKSIPNESQFISEGCIGEIQEKIKWIDEHEENIATWLTWHLLK